MKFGNSFYVCYIYTVNSNCANIALVICLLYCQLNRQLIFKFYMAPVESIYYNITIADTSL
jgi:hypothetical protein